MTMDTKALLAEAEALKPQLLTDRRTLHRNPEVGPSLPHTAAYVTERLTALGYTPRPLAGGVVADITGEDTGRCVLLRADMDALRVREATGLDFQSENGAMHACGHDMHAAMLLSAAALLKRHQADLKGTVRLVFQPDEEGFTGAKAMLAAGVLKDAPTPQAALALHVNSGPPPAWYSAAGGRSWRAAPCSGSPSGAPAAMGPCRRPAWTPSTSPPTSTSPCRS